MFYLLLLVLQSIAKIITKYYNQFQNNYNQLQILTISYKLLQLTTMYYNQLQFIQSRTVPPYLLQPPMFATDKRLLQFRNVKHILKKSKQSKQNPNQQYKIYLTSLMIEKLIDI